MIIRLLKPVPLINRVYNAGECVDSEKIFVELIQSGRAVLAEGNLPKKDPKPAEAPVADEAKENAQAPAPEKQKRTRKSKTE